MIANSHAAQLVAATESSEQTGTLVAESNINLSPPSLNTPSSVTPQCPLAILWDIENCPVPCDVRPEDVAGNIRMALRIHPIIRGVISMFSAYGDFNAFPRRVRVGCQRTGVKLVDVPNGRKDAADKAILVDMFLFALDNRPLSSIMLISGDVDFAPALHILGQRGYTVILVIPSGVGVSSALCNAGRFVWDWPSVARGEGFVPSMRSLMPSPYGINELADGPDEEAIVYRGLSQSFYNASRDFSIASQSLSEYTSANSMALPCSSSALRSQSLPPGINEVTTGDINALKGQLVKLLELSGGCLPLARIPAEYHKFFGRTLYISDGAFRLINLLKKMSDVMAVDGKGQNKFLYLRKLASSRKDMKGKGTLEENIDANMGLGLSDELLDEKKVVLEEHNEEAGSKMSSCKKEDQELEQFKYELQEILVSYSCRIFISCFEEVYKQRYKRLLDYKKWGASNLEELLSKVRDVVVLHEEPARKMKFLAAVGS